MASKSEGLSRVVCESMLFGCPVLVSSESGGALDLVKEGETGFVFHTVNECAELMQKVCLENHETMIVQAQEFAVNNLSQEVYAPRVLNVYKEVLLGKHGK